MFMGRWIRRGLEFLIGAICYGLTEILWRGYSHWSMLITGGMVFCALGRLHKRILSVSYLGKSIQGAIAVTITEGIVGLVANKLFRMEVWDYSHEKWNLGGQICLKYFCCWALLAVPAMLFFRLVDEHLKKMLP